MSKYRWESKRNLRRQVRTLELAVEHWVDRFIRLAEKKKDSERSLEKFRFQRDVGSDREMELARWLMSEWVFVHESKTDEVDTLLKPYIERLTDGTT